MKYLKDLYTKDYKTQLREMLKKYRDIFMHWKCQYC